MSTFASAHLCCIFLCAAGRVGAWRVHCGRLLLSSRSWRFALQASPESQQTASSGAAHPDSLYCHWAIRAASSSRQWCCSLPRQHVLQADCEGRCRQKLLLLASQPQLQVVVEGGGQLKNTQGLWWLLILAAFAAGGPRSNCGDPDHGQPADGRVRLPHVSWLAPLAASMGQLLGVGIWPVLA